MRTLTLACFSLVGLVSCLGCGDEDKSCFSPAQNLDTAYTDGAMGCGCVAGTDRDICVPDRTGLRVALVCENGRWHAVMDGPCMP
jgi:hypothetical protein